MRLDGVIVCVDYSDFLCFTLPLNKSHFNYLIVVSASHDERTKKLCEFWNVECLVTDVCYEDGAEFNKGKMINAGLAGLKDPEWVVHMDADIFLPPLFRSIVENLKLDDQGLYHVDRMMVTSFIDWIRFFTRPTLQHEANIYVHPEPFPLGVRLAKQEYGGWIPLGFFQMWNQGKMKKMYPAQHTDAGRSDLLFSLEFDRDHRHMLAEIIAIHLETKMIDGGKMGSNWAGRKTPEFGWEVLSPFMDLGQQAISDYFSRTYEE